jgi:hypothetical protein
MGHIALAGARLAPDFTCIALGPITIAQAVVRVAPGRQRFSHGTRSIPLDLVRRPLGPATFALERRRAITARASIGKDARRIPLAHARDSLETARVRLDAPTLALGVRRAVTALKCFGTI